MDHERRIKDLEDRVRSLDRNICLNSISVILIVLGCFIQMYKVNGIYTKISELISFNNQLIDFLREVIRNIWIIWIMDNVVRYLRCCFERLRKALIHKPASLFVQVQSNPESVLYRPYHMQLFRSRLIKNKTP